MGIELLSDESILRCYEQIRQQVAADLTTENRFRLMGGEAVKQRTERLRMEIDRRRLRCDPIEWGDLSEIRGTDPATKSPRVNGIKGRSAKVRACKRGAGPVCLGVRPIASTEWSASRSATSATYDAW